MNQLNQPIDATSLFWLLLIFFVLVAIIFAKATPEGRRAMCWTFIVITAIVVNILMHHAATKP